MRIHHGLTLLLLLSSFGCTEQSNDASDHRMCDGPMPSAIAADRHAPTKGALLATRFKSLDDFKALVKVEYYAGNTLADTADPRNNMVRLSYCSAGIEVVSILKSGVSEADFSEAQVGSTWDKILLGFKSPFAVKNRRQLRRVSLLARRNNTLFEAGDVAFYDLAEKTVGHISNWDSVNVHPDDLSEKGYLNTFNHITAQAFMTSMSSEATADFMGDIHERRTMPELVTGLFTQNQLKDSLNNPVDNYVDLLNNEWGQELGKQLKAKYGISPETHWTPELLARFLNDIQSYYSWALQLGFEPFRPADEVVTRFSNKINKVWDMYPN